MSKKDEMQTAVHLALVDGIVEQLLSKGYSKVDEVLPSTMMSMLENILFVTKSQAQSTAELIQDEESHLGRIIMSHKCLSELFNTINSITILIIYAYLVGKGVLPEATDEQWEEIIEQGHKSMEQHCAECKFQAECAAEYEEELASMQ